MTRYVVSAWHGEGNSVFEVRDRRDPDRCVRQFSTRLYGASARILADSIAADLNAEDFRDALEAVLAYNWDDELEDYRAHAEDGDAHVFGALITIDNFLRGVSYASTSVSGNRPPTALTPTETPIDPRSRSRPTTHLVQFKCAP